MKHIVLYSLLLFITSLHAQNEYDFTVLNEPYIPLTNAISLNEGQLFDDPEYIVPLGFTFSVEGNSFDTIYFPQGGFGAELNSSFNFEIGASTFIIPLAQDIISRMDPDGNSTSNISYKVEGAQGNKILKIEWENVGFIDDDTAADFMNFQVWLHESTNILEFRYGLSEINNPVGSFEESTGPVIAFAPYFNVDEGVFISDAYVLSGDPTDPEVFVFSGEDEAEGALNGVIPTGTVYRFNPLLLSTETFDVLNLTIYPNPVTELFSIQSNQTILSVTLKNSLGQNIKIFKDRFNTLSISEVPVGVYFVSITTENGTTVKRIIKN